MSNAGSLQLREYPGLVDTLGVHQVLARGSIPQGDADQATRRGYYVAGPPARDRQVRAAWADARYVRGSLRGAHDRSLIAALRLA